MSQSEIASLLLQLLGETRTYRGVIFNCLHLEPAEQIRFGKGLLKAMPEYERRLVEAVFEVTRAEITAERMDRFLAAHPMPAVTQ